MEKYINTFISFVLFIILFSCNNGKQKNVFLNNKEGEIPILNINEITDSISLNLEDITEWFKFVRLETNSSSLVSGNGNNNIIIDDKYILVSGYESSKNLVQFNRKGEFMKIAATKGKGPNEFVSFLENAFIRDNQLYFYDRSKTQKGFCKLNLNSGKLKLFRRQKKENPLTLHLSMIQ